MSAHPPDAAGDDEAAAGATSSSHVCKSFAPPIHDDGRRLRAAVDLFAALCAFNSAYRAADDLQVLTPFHSVAEPPIALADYMERVDKVTGCGEEAVLAAMILIGRHCCALRVMPSALSMHRLILVATRLAVKAHHDLFRSNRAYANAGGLPLQEVNDLEGFLLLTTGWRCTVSNEELKRLRSQLALAAESSTDAQLAGCVEAGILGSNTSSSPHAGHRALPAAGAAFNLMRAARPESADRWEQAYLREVHRSNARRRHAVDTKLSPPGMAAFSEHSSATAVSNRSQLWARNSTMDEATAALTSSSVASSLVATNGSGERKDATIESTRQHSSRATRQHGRREPAPPGDTSRSQRSRRPVEQPAALASSQGQQLLAPQQVMAVTSTIPIPNHAAQFLLHGESQQAQYHFTPAHHHHHLHHPQQHHPLHEHRLYATTAPHNIAPQHPPPFFEQRPPDAARVVHVVSLNPLAGLVFPQCSAPPTM